MNDSQEQTNSRPWLYKKGQSGNPGGRPKGSKSLKTYIRERFERMTDEEREEFLDGIDKKVLWEMGEGKPDTKTDITSDGKALHVIVPPAVAESFNLINAGANTETRGVHTEQE
jgi:hypothetical protein